MCCHPPYWKFHSLSNCWPLVMQPYKSVRCSIWKREPGARFLHATGSSVDNFRSERNTDWCYSYFNNLSTNSSTLRPPWSGACWTSHLPLIRMNANTCGLCLIYKSEKLTDQWFQVKLSPSSPYGNSELNPPPPKCLAFQTASPPPPHTFRIPVQETPLSLEILRCCPWYGMDIFWNHPKFPIICVRTIKLHALTKLHGLNCHWKFAVVYMYAAIFYPLGSKLSFKTLAKRRNAPISWTDNSYCTLMTDSVWVPQPIRLQHFH